MVLFTACSEKNGAVPADKKLNLANSFYTNGLYEDAVGEYLDYLQNYTVDDGRRANTYYTIAEIYFERMHDYQKALAYYYRVKYLYPESNLISDVNKRIVNCLERLERSGDARRMLDKETALDPSRVTESRPGDVLAQFGDRKITQGDLDFEISQLPPVVQEQLSGKEQKLEFLKQYVVEQLLYDSARREGLDEDKQIIEAAFLAKRRLMAQKILSRELEKQTQEITAADVELYYEANKDRYAEKDSNGKVTRQLPFSEVSESAARDLMMERQQEAYSKLIERLMRSEKVELFEKRVR